MTATATRIKTFDKTIQTTNVWLKDVQDELRWEDRHRVYLALRAVLRTLRDCLDVGQAANLAAQLPMLLRGVYYEGWIPAKVPLRMELEEFLENVRCAFRDETRLDAEDLVARVLRVIVRHIPRGELRGVKHSLSDELQALWPASLS